MADFRNPGDPGFSTLEVDHRGPHSTLEVKPGEGIEPSDSVPTTQKHPENPSEPVFEKPWWKRYWLAIVVVSILVTGGIIGGAVGGTLASKNEPDETGNDEDRATTSSSEPTNTTSSISSTTPTTSTTISYHTVKPTTTPNATAEPDDPIWVGRSEEDGEKFHVAFALDGTRNASCNYGVIPVPEPDNPCSHSFLLPNAFLYSWEGCGGPTWMTWRNPSSDDPEYHLLHEGNCEDVPRSFDCGDVSVSVRYLCGNNTLG